MRLIFFDNLGAVFKIQKEVLVMKKLLCLLFLSGLMFALEKDKLVNASLLSHLIKLPDQDFQQMITASHNFIYTADQEGRTLLLHAILQTQTGKMNFLLARGAQANITDFKGKNGLHYAAELANVDVVQALIQKKVNPKIIDNAEETPLHCLLNNYDPDNDYSNSIRISQTAEAILLSRDSYPQVEYSLLAIENGRKETPVDVALRNRNIPAICLFLDLCTNRLGSLNADTGLDRDIQHTVVSKIAAHFKKDEYLIMFIKDYTNNMREWNKACEVKKAEIEKKNRELEVIREKF